MGLFWRRKKDEFVSLRLNEPAVKEAGEETPAAPPKQEPQPPKPAEVITAPKSASAQPLPEVPQPAAHSTAPPESEAQPAAQSTASATPVPEAPQPRAAPPLPPAERPKPVLEPPVKEAAPRPVPSRSTFSSSILGLDRSMEELQAQEAALEQEFSARFRRAVAATRESLSERLDTVFAGRKQIDDELLDQLEEVLIAADIGVPTTLGILETVRRGIARQQINDLEALKQAIKDELLNILQASERQGVASETSVPETVTPYVMMIVGVNGVGKTTTIGKLAQRIKAEGNDVLICAADTFRAAASDQLAIWAERTGVPLIQQKHGTDPAAVLFDSLKAAKARGSDVLIVDTAGRLHTKSNLMAELDKMKRVAGREVEGAPHETLLVVDAVTGQNGLEQARQFLKVAGVTGIVLTKLDGTAKGGIAVAIAKELNLPIRYAGIGEKVDDLVVFDPHQYVNSLFGN
jgi:fused signal recognition particle receptor